MKGDLGVYLQSMELRTRPIVSLCLSASGFIRAFEYFLNLLIQAIIIAEKFQQNSIFRTRPYQTFCDIEKSTCVLKKTETPMNFVVLFFHIL